MDPFCFKKFTGFCDSLPAGLVKPDREEFVAQCNQFYLGNKDNGSLKDGYAEFCKHLFIPNFTEFQAMFAPVTKENEKFLVSAYEARRENELAVLNRWFPKEKIT